MDVASYRGHHDAALGASFRAPLFFHEGLEPGHGLFHDPGALDDLREEHLSFTEEVTDDLHAVHQRPLDDLQGPVEELARLLRVALNEVCDAVYQGVAQPFGDLLLAPGEPAVIVFFFPPGVFQPGGVLDQTLGGVLAPVEEDVLDKLEQPRIDLLVDLQHAGVHDRQVETGLDGVKQEGRMHRLADHVVAPEGEGDIAHPAAGAGAGAALLDPPDSLDEVDGVVVVFGDAGGDG